MAHLLPVALEKLIDELGRLPGVGSRTAERYAYYLLRADQRINDSLATAVHDVHALVKSCPITFALIDAEQEVKAGHGIVQIFKEIFLVQSNRRRLLMAVTLFVFHKLTGTDSINCKSIPTLRLKFLIKG